jgi:hypothetical protein
MVEWFEVRTLFGQAFTATRLSIHLHQDCYLSASFGMVQLYCEQQSKLWGNRPQSPPHKHFQTPRFSCHSNIAFLMSILGPSPLALASLICCGVGLLYEVSTGYRGFRTCRSGPIRHRPMPMRSSSCDSHVRPGVSALRSS